MENPNELFDQPNICLQSTLFLFLFLRKGREELLVGSLFTPAILAASGPCSCHSPLLGTPVISLHPPSSHCHQDPPEVPQHRDAPPGRISLSSAPTAPGYTCCLAMVHCPVVFPDTASRTLVEILTRLSFASLVNYT